jgi:hypothetical protein
MGELLGDDGFQTAFAVALAGSAVMVFVVGHRWVLGWAPGLIAPIAAVIALIATDRRGMLSLVGVALVALGALAVRRKAWSMASVAVAPGALVMFVALDSPVPDWARVILVVAIVFGTPFVLESDRGAPRVLPVLLAMTALGMYSTTPDTERTRVMAGALAGVLLLVLDRRLRSNVAGTAATAALLVWAATLDGYPRRGAVVGALACFGVAVLLAVVQRTRMARRTIPIAVVLVVHAGIVVVAARVAGLRSEAIAALAIAVPTWVIGALVLRYALDSTRRI